jgi:hypothetical protein
VYAFLGCRKAFNDTGRDVDDKPIPAADRQVLKGKRRTEVVFPDGVTLGEAFTTITAPGGVWAGHSPDDKPAWVAAQPRALADLLGEHYGVEVRDALPEGERGEHAARAHHFPQEG